MHHETRPDMFNVRTGDPGIILKFEHHLEQHIGEYDTIFHEEKSDFVHVDVHVIPPDAASDRNFYTCVTSGMSDMPMNVPDDCQSLQYAELLICLPPNWPMTKEAFIESDDNYWPIRWLRELARYPYLAQTWIFVDHTIPNDDPPQPLASNTMMSGMLIGFPFFFGEGFFELKVSDEKTIHFLQLFPVYQAEMEHCMVHGAESLWDKIFQKYSDDCLELIDPRRARIV